MQTRSSHCFHPLRLLSVIVMSAALFLIGGCGTLTGIPAHGGGKRFATEQRLVSASIRKALKKIDVSPITGKRAAIVFDLVSDEGAGNMSGGRLSPGSALSLGTLVSPETTSSSTFQVFELGNATNSYTNTGGRGGSTASTVTISSGTTDGKSTTRSNTATDTTTSANNTGTSITESNTSSSSNTRGSSSDTSTTTSSGTTTDTSTTHTTGSGNNESSGNSNTTTGGISTSGTYSENGSSDSTSTSSTTAAGTAAETSTTTGNSRSTGSTTSGSTTAGTTHSSGSQSSTSTSQANHSEQTNSQGTNSNKSTTEQTSNSESLSNTVGSSSSVRQEISPAPVHTRTETKGSRLEGSVSLVYRGLGEYQNFNVPKSDASLLMGLVRNYLLLNGVIPTTPTDGNADVLLYVTVDIFGTIRSRFDAFIYNNERVKAETSFEMMAFDRTGKLIMPPRNSNEVAEYTEHYLFWAGPLNTREKVYEGEGLLVDFSTVTDESTGSEKLKKDEKEKVVNHILGAN